MQDKETARGGLKRGDELLRRNIVRQNRANARTQGRGRSSERRRVRKKHHGEIRRYARRDEQIEKWLEGLAGRVNEDHFRGRVVEMAAELVKTCHAGGDFDPTSHQEILQSGAGQRGSGDNENGDHAATELLAGNKCPSCTVTRRILV